MPLVGMEMTTYSIAVATVEQENNEAWSWFLKNLLDDIGSVKDNMVGHLSLIDKRYVFS